MLKNVPKICSPELLKILCEMGHGDEIVIGDGNFPAVTNAKRLVRYDGMGVPEILDAVLKLIPLDTYVDSPAILMATGPDEGEPEIWAEYQKIIDENNGPTKMSAIERYDFYDRASEAFAVIATGESAIYANIILKKGVIK